MSKPGSCLRAVLLRYARLPFGLRPSPAVLGSVLLQHVSSYQEKNPEIVKVLKGLFVDDLSTGGETVDKAYEIYQQSKQVMKEGNFNLRKWNSNSQELIERIRKSEGQATTGGSDPKLGEEDQSYVQSCIGLSADNETLQQLSKVRIPRCLINGLSVRSYQIHGFSDASEQAYACVVYLRTEYENGEVDCRIIVSKARVAPIKQEAHEIALKEEANNSHMITHTLSSSTDVLSIQNLVNIERFGSKRKLLGTLAWVFRFVGNCKASLTNQTPDLNEELRNEEIERAEYKLLSYIQREEFSEDFKPSMPTIFCKPRERLLNLMVCSSYDHTIARYEFKWAETHKKRQ
eukprot:gene16500-7918_t